jgi:hypothetical protein
LIETADDRDWRQYRQRDKFIPRQRFSPVISRLIKIKVFFTKGMVLSARRPMAASNSGVGRLEVAMRAVKRAPPVLKGLAFEIPDLILLKGWADSRGAHLTIHLDHGSDLEDYEEVLAVGSAPGVPGKWMMWRGASAVVVRAESGRERRFRSVATAISALAREKRVAVTDIHATGWPGPTGSHAMENMPSEIGLTAQRRRR